MIVEGVEFGHIAGGSGVEGFFGRGDEYPHHRLLKPLGLLSFREMTFVAKTATLEPNIGNLHVDPTDGVTVRDWQQECIHVSPTSWWNDVMLNKVGLTNPGLKALLERQLWQKRTKPFMISFMSIKPTVEERIRELREAVEMLKFYLGSFQAPVLFQENFSCPNVGVDHNEELVDEIRCSYDIIGRLGIPSFAKVDALTSVYDIVEFSRHRALHGIVSSNAIKFGTVIPDMDWEKLFGFKTSPLEKVGKAGSGGGGASGAVLFPLVERQIARLRAIGFTKCIQAGGGVRTIEHARRLKIAGADSVFIASAAILTPWSVQTLINDTNRLYTRRSP